ncbi:hypothetical protein PF002_g17330 [Phytophthora fragariae]|nr:hypothetical protein PF011_g14885 [Phytophthora fragariae]KAE9214736.1 hypothetical protein PF004_g14961 [Phytophthora fragariae]KAE9215599.1 hypothetical protein PF002_g17330 [Phytophthora fragariae]KAE9299752.1 hypothetical protein PF001_g15295 [Phytophthora fragariae]
MGSPTEAFEVYTASLIATYMGDGLIYDSPLVQDVLGGNTSPRDYAVFLESETQTSTEGCAEVPLLNPDIYNYAFLSQGYQKIVNDTAYSSTMLSQLELVTVVVDCSFTQLKLGDTSAVRVFSLLRSEKEHTVLYMATVSLSLQDYEIRAHKKSGPALLGMLTVVNDMREETVEGFYVVALTYPFQRSLEFEVYNFVGITNGSYIELRSIPEDPSTQSADYLTIAREHGFYDGHEQFNIRYTYSLLESNASRSLTRWEWLGESVIADSWAWVHGIHCIYGLQTMFSLGVLLLVMYQNFITGRFWIGVPFASTSTPIFVLRGVLVMVTWYVNSFWNLYEFALCNAALLSGTEIVRVHEELVHADVLVVYLSIVAMTSSVIQERIPPSFAIFLFEIIHKHRLVFIRICPAVLREIVNYSNKVFRLEEAVVTPTLASMSPLGFGTAFQIPKKDGTFLAASFFPKISMLGIVAWYALMRKVYRHYYPESARQISVISTERSATERATATLKGNLTNFEISTGAELQTRFGIISDYKNYVYFKGMKFASADGVYCSGYVIVNGKHLMRAKDLPAVVMIKLLKTRFANVHVYEVAGNAVKDTAQLVLPEMFTWDELWRLNVTVLL